MFVWFLGWLNVCLLDYDYLVGCPVTCRATRFFGLLVGFCCWSVGLLVIWATGCFDMWTVVWPVGYSFGWLLFFLSVAWLIGRLITWWASYNIDWWLDCLGGCLAGWFFGWLVGCLAGWLAGCWAGYWSGCLSVGLDCLVGWLVIWLDCQFWPPILTANSACLPVCLSVCLSVCQFYLLVNSVLRA